MERGFELPGSECVEEHSGLFLGLVEMKLIEQGIVRMLRVENLVELRLELFELGRTENPDPWKKPIFFEVLELLRVESIVRPLAR